MKLSNSEIIELLLTLENYFDEDLSEILEYVEDNDYEYDDLENTFNLHTYSEISDLFRRHIIPFNDFFSNNNIKEIKIINDHVFLYDFITKEFIELNPNQQVEIRKLDIKAFGKFVF